MGYPFLSSARSFWFAVPIAFTWFMRVGKACLDSQLAQSTFLVGALDTEIINESPSNDTHVVSHDLPHFFSSFQVTNFLFYHLHGTKNGVELPVAIYKKSPPGAATRHTHTHITYNDSTCFFCWEHAHEVDTPFPERYIYLEFFSVASVFSLRVCAARPM